MRRLVSLLVALGVAGCTPAVPDDGYRFERKEFDRRQVVVTGFPMASQTVLREEAKRLGVTIEKVGNRELMAFGFVGKTASTCRIYYVDPQVKHEPVWSGHELMHCFYGRWHS